MNNVTSENAKIKFPFLAEIEKITSLPLNAVTLTKANTDMFEEWGYWNKDDKNEYYHRFFAIGDDEQLYPIPPVELNKKNTLEKVAQFFSKKKKNENFAEKTVAYWIDKHGYRINYIVKCILNKNAREYIVFDARSFSIENYFECKKNYRFYLFKSLIDSES